MPEPCEANSSSANFNAFLRFWRRVLQKILGRFFGHPRGYASPRFGRPPAMDRRDFVKPREHAARAMRNVELQHFAAFELALDDQSRQAVDAFARQRADATRKEWLVDAIDLVE